MTSTSSTIVHPKPVSKPPGGSAARVWQVVIALIVAMVFLAGCSAGPGSREEFVEVLTRDENLSVEEATCISDGVFDKYGADEGSLSKISSATSLQDLEGEDGVAGFAEFYDETVLGCVQTGPTPG